MENRFETMKVRNLLLIFLLVGFLTSCQEEFNKLQDKIDEVKTSEIAPIKSQIDSIKVSIGELEEMDVALKSYIDTLETTAANLRTAINANDAKIDQIAAEIRSELSNAQTNLTGQIALAKTEVLNQLTALRGEMQTQMATVDSTLAVLKAKDTALETQIANLSTYVNDQISDTRDWASVTFSTLEQYNATVTEIAAIKASITTLNTSLTQMETRLNTKIATDIAAAVSTLEGKLQQSVTDVTSAYTTAIATAKTELTTAYTSAIQSAITSSEVSTRSWVNEQLTGYYTIAETDAKIASLKTNLEGQLNSQRTYLEGVISSLEASLTTKINGNKSLIDGLQTQLNSASGALSTLATTVTTNSNNISANATAIAANAQSISTNAGNIEACNTAIAANRQLINANDAAIKANATAITALQNRATSDEANIVANATAIAKNASDIATNASLISSNATAISNNAQAISNNAADIVQLRSDLATARTEITTAYTSAIATAINTLHGTISGEIATQIATVNTRINNEVAAIEAAIATLSGRVTACETAITEIRSDIQTLQGGLANLQSQVEAVLARIQSIVVIPSYSDGSVACTMGDNEFYFEVLPSGAASRLAAVGKDIFKLKAVYTQTKAAPSFVNLPISSVHAEGDILVVTASASGLTITAEQSANAVLTVASGVSSISTEYFPLYFAASSLVVNATLSASTPFSASFACNVSKTEGITEYGICYSEGNSLCNNTTTSHNMDETGVFTVDLTSLTPKTSYYYRAYAIIGGVAMYSGLKTFATEEISTEMIHTTEINDVTAFSAHCSGSIDSRLLDYPSIIIGICYSNITNTPTLSDYYYTVSLISQTGVFSSTLTGLMPNSPYHCRVYAKLGEETIYGNVLSFNTNTSEDVVFSLSCDSISYSTITLKGKVNVPNDSYESIAMGFYYNTTNSFDQYTNHVFVSSLGSDDTFIADISVFENTQYYYKAFAVIDGTTFYGNVLSVTSSEIQVSTNAILDLGLSVKWAGSNVGAASPELMGNTYAWGELTANKTVNYLGWDNYKYCMGTPSSITKYNTDASCGVVDNKTRLEFSDDAAYQSSGGTMRIPTKTEMEELINNCTWIWGTYKGVKGFKIWNKADPNHNAVMFLPTKTESSPDEEENHEEATSDAAYWTSDLRYSSDAYRLYISNTIWSREFGSYSRAYPANIRAVVNIE